MKEEFETYFPNNFYEKCLSVPDPHQAYNHENDLSLSNKEQLIEPSSDTGLKMQFRDLGLVRFWFSPSVRSEFPELSETALKIGMQFLATYLREKVFSSLLHRKTKHRNRLSVIADLGLKLANIEPDIQ
jgi:hypothetical protein